MYYVVGLTAAAAFGMMAVTFVLHSSSPCPGPPSPLSPIAKQALAPAVVQNASWPVSHRQLPLPRQVHTTLPVLRAQNVTSGPGGRLAGDHDHVPSIAVAVNKLHFIADREEVQLHATAQDKEAAINKRVSAAKKVRQLRCALHMYSNLCTR